ncbi:MAG: DUF1842 domain-containing protein [Bacteroidetes bacterium]|nr:DUF1842 domain-containing protein [Bacteroidota bacterium]
MEIPETLKGTYPVIGMAGNVGTPGAPILHFSLLVVPSAGSVTGTAVITQALAAPNDKIIIKHVTGTIVNLVFGADFTHHVSLNGYYDYVLPPPAIGIIRVEFTAHMVVNAEWNGKGGFTYGHRDVTNVPVKSTK